MISLLRLIRYGNIRTSESLPLFPVSNVLEVLGPLLRDVDLGNPAAMLDIIVQGQ